MKKNRRLKMTHPALFIFYPIGRTVLKGVEIANDLVSRFGWNGAEENKNSEVLAKQSFMKNHVIPFFGDKLMNEIRNRDLAFFNAHKIAILLMKKFES
jgi:hypothetical protein